jgi:hypothetical protein
MSDWEIIDLFDTTQITLRELSRITERPEEELKALLMETNKGN